MMVVAVSGLNKYRTVRETLRVHLTSNIVEVNPYKTLYIYKAQKIGCYKENRENIIPYLSRCASLYFLSLSYD